MLLSRQTQAVARLPRQASTPAGPSRPRCSAVAPLAAAVAAPPASLDVKSFKDGSSAGAPATLSLAVAEEDTAGAVVHRYVVMLRQNARAGTASTLTRAEVQGGGKKPYAQKGTGNARRGSQRTPLRPGGGIIFGPKPRDWGIKMNKKERRLALGTALQSAAADTLVVDAVSLSSPKTSELVAALARLGADPMAPGAHILLLVEEVGQELAMASRNIEGLTLARVGALNAYDVLRADRIVVEKGALAAIQDFYGPKAE